MKNKLKKTLLYIGNGTPIKTCLDVYYKQFKEKQKKYCRDCGAEIKFIKNTYSGKNMPVDANPIKIVTDEGKVISGYIPHWDNPACKFKENLGNLELNANVINKDYGNVI